ncbi:MAG: methionine ABC transporter permease [Coriobacteriales bacterium]|jgi:D-methionine transport system permease protein
MSEVGAAIADFWGDYGQLLLSGTWATLEMTILSTLFAYVIGIPLGVLVTITRRNSLWPHPVLSSVLGWIVNIFRSIPFIILLVFLMPFTRALVGTTMGVLGAIPPLVIAAAPFVARMVEQSLQEVSPGLIEAAQASGATNAQIVWKVMLKEAMPSIVRGVLIAFITLFGYVAMAGTIGAGGLGDIAMRYGYYRYQDSVMYVTLVILIIIVQIAQSIGDVVARRVDKKMR